MGILKSKISRITVAVVLLALVAVMQQDSAAPTARTQDAASAPIQTAGFGGVLVSKRLKMILGFVQTLPV